MNTPIKQPNSTSCFQYDQGNTKMQKPKLTRSHNCLGVPASLDEWEAIVDTGINHHSPWSSKTDLVSMAQDADDEWSLQQQIDERAMKVRETKLQEDIDTYNLNNPNPKWLSVNGSTNQSPLFNENDVSYCLTENEFVLEQTLEYIYNDMPAEEDESEDSYADPDYIYPISREDAQKKQAIADARMVAYELAHPVDYSEGHRFTDEDFAHLSGNITMDQLTEVYQEREKKEAEEVEKRLALIDYNASQFTFQEEDADLPDELDTDKNEMNRQQLIQEFCNRNGWNHYLKPEEAEEVEEGELIEAEEHQDEYHYEEQYGDPYQYEEQEDQEQQYDDQYQEQEYDDDDQEKENNEPCLPPKPLRLRREEARDSEDLLEQSRIYAEICKLAQQSS